MKTFFKYFLILLLCQQILRAEDIAPSCKIRLPHAVNGYQNVVTPVISPDGGTLFFDRKRHPGNKGGLKDEDDVWSSIKNRSGFWREAKNAGLPLNSRQSDVLFSITPDGNKALYYTSRLGGSFYFLKPRKNGWTLNNPVNIENYYNKSGNFFGCLSGTSQYLILSLERDDSHGGLDIYYSKRVSAENNKYSKPKNLGSVINDKSRQVSPFLAYDDKTLYFTADTGSGNLDIFFSRRLDNTWKNWSEPESLGCKINTEFDDTSPYLTITGDSAYIISSDTADLRPGIYKICLPEKYRPLPYSIVTGRVLLRTGVTDSVLHEAEIRVKFSDGYWAVFYPNSSDGRYTFTVPHNQDAVFFAEYNEMESEKIIASSRGLTQTEFIYSDIILKREINKPGEIPTVYFETAGSGIGGKYTEALYQTASFLKNNERKIIITGHADRRGSESFNLTLSRKRAESVKEFLVNAGIAPNRIEIISKGESEAFSDNHARHRRVDIEVK